MSRFRKSLEQQCSKELPVMMEVFYICTVIEQRLAIYNVASATEELKFKFLFILTELPHVAKSYRTGHSSRVLHFSFSSRTSFFYIFL